jgi:hypothetical protein
MNNTHKHCLAFVFAALVLSACSRTDYTHGTMAAPTYGLSPITVKLQNRLIEVINQTDELDAMIKRGCTADDFFSAGAPIEKSALELEHTLPSNDPRIYLFISSMEEYQQLGVKLSHNESKDELSSTDVIAGMRKTLLLGVLNGTLDDSETKMFDDLKQQIESGKM